MTKQEIPVPGRVPAEPLLRRSVLAECSRYTHPRPVLRAGGMSPYRPTRRGFLVGAGSLLALVPYGCGTDGETGEGGEETAPDDTRTVDTPRGQVTIPAEPQRLVVVYPEDLGHALALGLPVVAGPGESGQPGAPFPSYLVEVFGEKLDGVTRIAYQPETNLEQLAELRPDAILTFFSDGYDAEYNRLEQIAPLVTYDNTVGESTVRPWRATLRRIGEQFARQGAAEDFIARFGERAADLQERLEPRWAGATYAVVEPYPDSFYLFGPDTGHVPRTLNEELGLVLAESVRGVLADAEGIDSSVAETVSYEKLGALEDADVIFVPVYAGEDGAPDRSGTEELTAQELWSTLPAVQARQVHEFTGDITYTSGATATAFLDVVERALLG